MTVVTRLGALCALLFLTFVPAAWAQNATLTGTVTDAGSGTPLPGANIRLMADGALIGGGATDLDGRYRVMAPAGDYTLVVTFIGYQEYQRPLTLAAGQTARADVALMPGGFDLNTVVVSASRQQEKVLDAPASISVLEAREIQQEVTPSSVEVLRNTTGVDISQTGIDRREVVLRGFNNAFSGAAYTLVDYRQAAVAALGVNVYSLMPIPSIDLERVEVVRGPGSALYGPGVDAGVVHFITKDPFTHPGTSVSVAGGERSFFAGQLRHAGVVNDRLGYKIVGNYAQGNEWALNLTGCQRDAAGNLIREGCEDPDDFDQRAFSGELLPRENDFWKYGVTGQVQYRFAPDVTLTANGGFSEAASPVLTGIGTAQAKGFGYTFGQLRLQAGRLFAQAYLNRNNAGDSFVYGRALPGSTPQNPLVAPLVDKGILFNTQAQYNLDLNQGKQRLIFGADYEMTRPDTEGTIIGRNEDDDTISEIGVYAQSSTTVNEKLDVLVALRGDYNNIQEKLTFSPRAALVFKANAANTFRATYNRAFSSPGINSNFLDIRAQENTIAGPYKLVFYGRGAAQGFTFDNFRDNRLASLILPIPSPTGGNFFGSSLPVGAVPQVFVYGAFANGLARTLNNAAIPSAALPAPFNALNQPQRAALAGILSNLTNFIPLTATTAGTLGIPDDSDRGFREVAGPVDIGPLEQTTTQTVELGYKGLIKNKVLLAVDGYYTQKENFIGPLSVESPLVYLQNLGPDLAATLTQVLAQAAQADPTAGAFLAQLGLTPQTAAGLLAGLAQGSFASTPVAVVQPDQAVLPAGSPGTEVGGFLSYRNYGKVQFWGVDASLQILATEQLNVFANLSLVSDDFFDNEELDEAGTDLSLALNAPTLKTKAGFSYDFRNGFRVNGSGRYTEGFPVRSGPYVGDVESYFLLDLGAGYSFSGPMDGLSLDVTVQNLLDDEHREFIGAPRLGRMAIARLSYSF